MSSGVAHSIACCLGEETQPHLTTPFSRIVVESDKVSLISRSRCSAAAPPAATGGIGMRRDEEECEGMRGQRGPLVVPRPGRERFYVLLPHAGTWWNVCGKNKVCFFGPLCSKEGENKFSVSNCHKTGSTKYGCLQVTHTYYLTLHSSSLTNWA